MNRPVTLALLQTTPQSTLATAREHALALAHDALQHDPALILLPEYCGGLRTVDGAFRPPLASEDRHPVLQALREFARTTRVWVVAGSIGIGEPDGARGDGDGNGDGDSHIDTRFANRGFVIDDTGRIAARYDKLHLFDFTTPGGRASLESDHVIPGEHAVLLDTPFARLGYTICYDLRFPELYRQLAQAGAELLLAPSAFTRRTGDAHWHVLNRARAIENGAFVVAPCAVGDIDGGGGSYGHSLVVDPWGDVLLDAGTEPGAYACTIDVAAVARVRTRLPSLQHDRPFILAQADRDTPDP